MVSILLILLFRTRAWRQNEDNKSALYHLCSGHDCCYCAQPADWQARTSPCPYLLIFRCIKSRCSSLNRNSEVRLLSCLEKNIQMLIYLSTTYTTLYITSEQQATSASLITETLIPVAFGKCTIMSQDWWSQASDICESHIKHDSGQHRSLCSNWDSHSHRSLH